METPRNSIQAVAEVMDLLELAQNGNTELAGRCAQLEHELANARRCIRIHEIANMQNTNNDTAQISAAELERLRFDNSLLQRQVQGFEAARKVLNTPEQHAAYAQGFWAGYTWAALLLHMNPEGLAKDGTDLRELVQSWCKTKAAPLSELIEPGCLPRPEWPE